MAHLWAVPLMTPTNEDYTIAAFCEAVTNDLDNRVTWYALQNARNGMHPNGKQFDDNVTAAIQAGEWLDRAVERYKPTP